MDDSLLDLLPESIDDMFEYFDGLSFIDLLFTLDQLPQIPLIAVFSNDVGAIGFLNVLDHFEDVGRLHHLQCIYLLL